MTSLWFFWWGRKNREVSVAERSLAEVRGPMPRNSWRGAPDAGDPHELKIRKNLHRLTLFISLSFSSLLSLFLSLSFCLSLCLTTSISGIQLYLLLRAFLRRSKRNYPVLFRCSLGKRCMCVCVCVCIAQRLAPGIRSQQLKWSVLPAQPFYFWRIQSRRYWILSDLFLNDLSKVASDRTVWHFV